MEMDENTPHHHHHQMCLGRRGRKVEFYEKHLSTYRENREQGKRQRKTGQRSRRKIKRE